MIDDLLIWTVIVGTAIITTMGFVNKCGWIWGLIFGIPTSCIAVIFLFFFFISKNK